MSDFTNALNRFKKFIAPTSPLLPEFYPKKAKGVFIYDQNDRPYYDMISGISVSNLGHGYPDIIKAIQNQSELFLHAMVFGEYLIDTQINLAETLTSVLPNNLNSVFFVNSGSEAVEGALKLAKRYTERNEIISFKNAYHGSTIGALSVCGNETLKNSFRPLIPGIKHLNFSDYNHLNEISNKTACVIIEPVQGEAGVIIPEKGYLKKLADTCHEYGALLIFDEIQTGMGRTGSLFAFEQENCVPDILCLAKAFGGGLPLGAFISSKEIMLALSENPALGHITTFGGHPLACSTALASLNALLHEPFVSQVNEKSKLFSSHFEKIPGVKNIRTSGLLLAVEFESEQINFAVIETCRKNGVLTDWFLFNQKSMRLAPPLIISNEQIKDACDKITQAIANVLT